MKYYDLLLRITEKPHLYGIENVRDLRNFHEGVDCCIELFNIDSNELKDFKNFKDFVTKKYDASSMQNWAKIISYNSIGNRDSLMTFKRLLEEYLETKK